MPLISPTTIPAAGLPMTAGSIVVFKPEPQQRAAIFTATNPLGCNFFFETSIDNGATDPWSPAAALKESKLALDGGEATGISPPDGVNGRWGVDTIYEGSFVRMRVVTGTITLNNVRSVPFFLGSSALSAVVDVGADKLGRMRLMELMRIRVALGDPNSTHDLVQEVSMLDVIAAIAATT